MRKRFWDDFATAYKIGKDLWESNARVRDQEGLSNAMRDAMQEQSQQVYGGASPEEIARAQAEADRLSAQDAAEFGLTPEEQRIYAPQVATQKVVGARYGLGAVPTDWRDTPYTQEEKFQNALRAGADYYLRSGDMDKYMDYKAKASQIATAGLQRQALESQLQDREDQRRRENEFRNYVAGSSLGGLQGIKAEVERTGGTWTPEAEAIYAKQGYATNQVDFMKGLTRYMADPAQVMNAMKLVDNFQKEGVLNALRLAASGASKEEVAQAFNGVGDIRANVTDLKQGTWVNPYTGKKETTTYLTYQTPDGKTGTVNVTEQLLRYEDAAKLMQLSINAKHYDDWARVMAQRAADISGGLVDQAAYKEAVKDANALIASPEYQNAYDSGDRTKIQEMERRLRDISIKAAIAAGKPLQPRISPDQKLVPEVRPEVVKAFLDVYSAIDPKDSAALGRVDAMFPGVRQALGLGGGGLTIPGAVGIGSAPAKPNYDSNLGLGANNPVANPYGSRSAMEARRAELEQIVGDQGIPIMQRRAAQAELDKMRTLYGK